MKKILASIVAVVFVCLNFSVFARTEKEYDCSEWAKEGIEKAFDWYLLDPEYEYNFKENISREEFCELVFRFIAQSPYFEKWIKENVNESTMEFPKLENPFNDTDDVKVLFLYHTGVIEGKTETEFAPDDSLTREEAATIIVRVIDLVAPMDVTDVWYEYSDMGDISDWAQDSIQRISNMGFMEGVGDNKFAPKDTYTTEQAVVTILRAFNNNILKWMVEYMKQDAGELGYVYENDTWNYVTYDMARGRRVKPIDANKDELRVIYDEKFACDNESVYYGAEKIEGADPDTFEIVSDSGKMRYAKDKNSVYIYLDDYMIMKIEGADPETFEVLQFPYAKDKNDAYNGCLPLYVDDASKFEVIESGEGYLRISYPEAFFSPAMNSDEVLEYNKQKYGHIDYGVIYSEEGKARTEKLVYEGYRMIEDNR